MARLRDVIRYLVVQSPSNGSLSKPRLTKLVYLSDWEAACALGHQLTAIRWTINPYGPYVDDVILAVMHDRSLRVRETSSAYGTPKSVIEATPGAHPTMHLVPDEQSILDTVMEQTCPMSWTAFIAHVYDTYPIRSQARYSELHLVELAGSRES